jgi:hypothetical protein
MTVLASAMVLLGYAGYAGAYTATLSWEEPGSSTITGFNVHLGSAYGLSDIAVQSLGLPVPSASGVYTATVTVADGTSPYASVTAIDNTGSESIISNGIVLQPSSSSLGAPGQPVLVP